MDVAWEEAVLSSRISPNYTSQKEKKNLKKKGRRMALKAARGRCLPEDREADIDKEVGATAGNEEDTDGRNYWSRVSVRYCQTQGRESRESEHLRKMVTITTRMADAGFDMLLLY